MVARSVVAVSLLLLCSPALASQQRRTSTRSRGWQYVERNILSAMGEIWVVKQASGEITVTVMGLSTPDPTFKPTFPYPASTPLAGLKLQVWVLRKNGTALGRQGGPMSMAVSNAVWRTE